MAENINIGFEKNDSRKKEMKMSLVSNILSFFLLFLFDYLTCKFKL